MVVVALYFDHQKILIYAQPPAGAYRLEDEQLNVLPPPPISALNSDGIYWFGNFVLQHECVFRASFSIFRRQRLVTLADRSLKRPTNGVV
jgi:hypothetical protein